MSIPDVRYIVTSKASGSGELFHVGRNMPMRAPSMQDDKCRLGLRAGRRVIAAAAAIEKYPYPRMRASEKRSAWSRAHSRGVAMSKGKMATTALARQPVHQKPP